jgi:CPA2 family monovalent cation:H+ antiporter-2
MILADLGITESTARDNTQEVRAVVSTVFLVLGSLFLGGWIALLSSTILPGTRSLLLLTPLLLFLLYLLRDTFHKLYVQGKGALVATFDNHALEKDPVAKEEKGHLLEARLEAFMVSADNPCVGRLIGETGMRTRTGASIVGIGRAGNRIINPGPDEEISAGDQLLLLGDRQQLAAAGALLRTGPGVRKEAEEAGGPPATAA